MGFNGKQVESRSVGSLDRIAGSCKMFDKEQAGACCAEVDSTCGAGALHSEGGIPSSFAQQVHQILEEQEAVVSTKEQDRFIEHVQYSVRRRRLAGQVWSRIQGGDDIIGLIQMARDSGDLDEAVWRCFFAAHFGRASASPTVGNQIQSASRVLCAFGSEPLWTWRRVSENPNAFYKWLLERRSDLQTISYGNHRKFESKSPEIIWSVVESFVLLVQRHGGPNELFNINSSEQFDDDQVFDMLYRKLTPIRRFGRTGRFDFLVLLRDLNLIAAQPISCYLRGATGPCKGARRLWGHRPISELEQLAADLAERLNISAISVEDALCNWQK
jgi:hypothetical protein